MNTRILRRGLIGLGVLLAGAIAAPAAFARTHVSIGLGFYGPGYSVGINDCVNCYRYPAYAYGSYAYPSYYYPAYYPTYPAYYAPPPRYYYRPAPVRYYSPYPVYGTVYYNNYHHDHDHGWNDYDRGSYYHH